MIISIVIQEFSDSQFYKKAKKQNKTVKHIIIFLIKLPK